MFLLFYIEIYAYNKNICLKLRNICFAKFIDSLKITSQVIKFDSQFALMTIFFNKFKKLFRPIFGLFSQFLRQKKFPGKSSSVTHNFWVSSTITKFRKTWWCNSKKTPGQTEGRTERRKTDRQTPFSRPLPATARVPITRSWLIRLNLIYFWSEVWRPSLDMNDQSIKIIQTKQQISWWHQRSFSSLIVKI